jgi:CRISPR-associated protein Cas1
VEQVPIRRLVPARDDALPVYVQTAYGAVGIRGDRIVVTREKEEIHTSCLLDVAHLCLLGRITVSPHAVHVLCERGIPITHMSTGGWFYGVTKGMPHKNVDLRIAQYRVALDDSASLRLARVIVAGKVRNQRTLLRRNLGTRAAAAVAELTRLLTGISVAPDLGQLLGHEGAAARTYFAHLGAMLSPSSPERPWSFDFSARNRRPPLA